MPINSALPKFSLKFKIDNQDTVNLARKKFPKGNLKDILIEATNRMITFMASKNTDNQIDFDNIESFDVLVSSNGDEFSMSAQPIYKEPKIEVLQKNNKRSKEITAIESQAIKEKIQNAKNKFFDQKTS